MRQNVGMRNSALVSLLSSSIFNFFLRPRPCSSDPHADVTLLFEDGRERERAREAERNAPRGPFRQTKRFTEDNARTGNGTAHDPRRTH